MSNHLLTRDRIAKQLEIEAIAHYIKDGMTVLDVGCGDGETLIELARRYEIAGIGYDSSIEMLKLAAANEMRTHFEDMKGTVSLFQSDLLKQAIPALDLVYSERTLVCLPDWETQKRAIANIARCLKPGGLYVMCECSQDGLDAVNAMRAAVALPPVMPPAWDRYLRDDEIEAFAADNNCGLTLEGVDDYSSAYYFLSRVVNARLAADEGREPDYDAPVNRMALSLPPIAGLRGQGRLWLWRKV